MSGKSTGSCGHDLTEKDNEGMGYTILVCELSWLREEDENGNQCYSTETGMTICKKCLRKYERRGNIIRNFNKEKK